MGIYFHKLTYITLIIFVLYGFFLAIFSLENVPKSNYNNPPLPYLIEKPLTEDGYYMMTVAWNFAEGHGFVYNYKYKTSGVQPISTLIYSLIAFIIQKISYNKYLFARAIILFSLFLQVAFGIFIYKITKFIFNSENKIEILFFSLLVTLMNFKVFLNFANGLETGIYLVLLGLFFYFWLVNLSKDKSIKKLISMGLLTGLIILTRFDFIIISLVFYFFLFLYKKINLKEFFIIISIAFIIFLPWQIYIIDTTGHILQSSARSQISFQPTLTNLDKSVQFIGNLIQHFTPFLYTGNVKFWLIIPLGILYVTLVLIFLVKLRLINFYIINPVIKSLILSFFVLSIIYFLFSTAPHFYFRYLSFWMVIFNPLFVKFFSEFLKLIGNSKVFTIYIVIVLIFFVQAFLYFHSGKAARSFSVRVDFVKNNFNQQNKIGSFQSGILGYFCSNVINLDGKINHTALLFNQNKKLNEFIDSLGIDVLIEWKEIIETAFPKEYLNKFWLIYSQDIGDNRTICLVRKRQD